MTIYNTAYDTTVCHMFKLDKIVDAIKVAQIREYPTHRDGVVMIEATDNTYSAIPEFKHPVYIGKADINNMAGRVHTDWSADPVLALNLRNACRKDPNSPYGYKVVNSTLYRTLAYRAALNMMWLENGGNAFRAIYPVTLALFAQWVANSITFRWGIDYATKVKIIALAGLWYASNHNSGIEFERNDEDRQLAAISNALKSSGVKPADVFAAYDSVKLIGSMEEFCSKAKVFTGDVRLEDLNAGTLITLMGGTWPVDNGPELVGVALEHPPTFLAMLYECTVNLAIRKSGLARLAEDKRWEEGIGKIRNVVAAHAPGIVDLVESRINGK